MNNLTGKRFGRLLVLEITRRIKTSGGQSKILYLCRCDCGILKEIRAGDLTSGCTISCGCWGKEKRNQAVIIHGESSQKTKLYNKWKHMRYRCFNSKNEKHKYYFDRGIQIHKDWLNYRNFRQWAYESGYQDGLSIDRINSDGNYEPSNCQWLTMAEHSKKSGLRAAELSLRASA